MAYDQGYAKLVQDHVHGVTALTMPTGLRVRFMTTVGSATANGTELATSGGYTSGTGAPTVAFAASTTATPSVSANSAAVTVTNMPAATINGIELWEGTPVRMELGTLATARTAAAGDTLSFAVSAMSSTLA